MLDLLEDYLLAKGYSYERIDGKIRGSDRQVSIYAPGKSLQEQCGSFFVLPPIYMKPFCFFNCVPTRVLGSIKSVDFYLFKIIALSLTILACCMIIKLQAAIDRYSAKNSSIFVFLLSTRAGGLGITLTAVRDRKFHQVLVMAVC